MLRFGALQRRGELTNNRQELLLNQNRDACLIFMARADRETRRKIRQTKRKIRKTKRRVKIARKVVGRKLAKIEKRMNT